MMKMRYLLIFLMTAAIAAMACGGEANVNVTRNTTNANVNKPPPPSPAPTLDCKSMSREEYDKNKAQCEKEKGSSTIGQGINDSWIWFKTRTALLAASDLRDSTINVDVANDVITLKGTVANAAQKASAEKVAKGIEGQKGVKNELKVAPNDSVTNMKTSSNTNTGKK